MKKYYLANTWMLASLLIALTLYLSSCKDDDAEPQPQPTGNTKVYPLSAKDVAGISGTVTFAERSDDAVVITIQLTGTTAGGDHPAHIHNDNAAAGGGIVLDLINVDGATGKSETVVLQLNDGTPITYSQLLDFDGYVNVHQSATSLATIIAQGDIGQNELTGESELYPLGPMSDPAISGTLTLEERKNGETLATISLVGTTAGGDHPAHIHNNSAAQGGGIAIDFNNVNGGTGKSITNITQLNSGTAITYSQLLDFNGYANVHLSPTSLPTLIAQGDIGQNVLTGEAEVYELKPVSDPAISGTVTFAQRKNNQTLVTIELEGTSAAESHPSHIHANTALQGGGIVIDLTNVNGATGISRTNVTQLNNETPITYDELIEFNGYVNSHLSSGNLATLVAQGDIGQNSLTGDSKEYELGPVSDPGISGTATFEKRKNGTTLVTILLEGTTAGGDHPSHIHNNSASEGGGIAIDLTNVNGDTGKSATNVTQLNSGTAITYDELLEYNGYVNVHLSGANLATLIAQGDIGSNAP